MYVCTYIYGSRRAPVRRGLKCSLFLTKGVPKFIAYNCEDINSLNEILPVNAVFGDERARTKVSYVERVDAKLISHRIQVSFSKEGLANWTSRSRDIGFQKRCYGRSYWILYCIIGSPHVLLSSSVRCTATNALYVKNGYILSEHYAICELHMCALFDFKWSWKLVTLDPCITSTFLWPLIVTMPGARSQALHWLKE